MSALGLDKFFKASKIYVVVSIRFDIFTIGGMKNGNRQVYKRQAL